MTIRILHASQTMASGGAAAGIRNVIDSLRSPQFEHFIVVEKMSEAEHAATPSGAELYAIPPCPSLLWWRRLKVVRRLIRDLRINVVHGRAWPGTDALVAASSVQGVALILSGHGRPAAQATPRTFPQRTLYKWLGSRLDRAFAVTPELAAELAKDIGWPRQNVEVILNTVDMFRFVPRVCSQRESSGGVFRIGVAGRLVPVKRIDLVLEMARRVVAVRGSDAMIIDIAGDGPLRDIIEADIKRHGLEKNVLLRGKVTDMPNWYQSLNAFVSTSDFEGCSNVILEALACAIPVIATDVGVNRMLIEENQSGFIVPTGDASSLMDKVVACIDNPVFTASLGQTGRRRLKEASQLQNYQETYTRLYQEAASNRQQSLWNE